MNRLFPRPVLSVWLALIWAALWGDWSAGTLVFGLLAGVCLPFALRMPPANRNHPLRRALKAWQFAGLVAWDILSSNITVAAMILGRRPATLQPALITLPLSLTRPEAITLLAATITLTPGTLTAEVAADRRSLLIHCLHAPDPQQVIAQTLARYETRIKEFME